MGYGLWASCRRGAARAAWPDCPRSSRSHTTTIGRTAHSPPVLELERSFRNFCALTTSPISPSLSLSHCLSAAIAPQKTLPPSPSDPVSLLSFTKTTKTQNSTFGIFRTGLLLCLPVLLQNAFKVDAVVFPSNTTEPTATLASSHLLAGASAAGSRGAGAAMVVVPAVVQRGRGSWRRREALWMWW